MATTSESIVDLHHDISFDEKDELDSLPSSASSDVYSDADSEAQAEWERSLEQLQLILTMMIVPWMGKFFGRKFAYWSWGKYMQWIHNVEIRFTNKKKFEAAGAVQAATI